MSNLNIENLTHLIQPALPQGGNVASEARVSREMQTQGMEPATPEVNGVNFSDVLRQSVDKVNTLQNQADTAIKELVAGRTKNIHETMLAVERADASLKLAMQVRNKILDAYREVMRMQI